MNEIIRKQMKDVIVPQNDVMRRPVIVPEQMPSQKSSVGKRIEQNPFFEKTRTKKAEQQKSAVTERSGGSGVKGALWALLFTLLLAFGFVIANYFATATVEIVPITRTATLDATITAPKEALEGELTYSLVTLPEPEEKTKEVSATIEKKMQVKASGKVKIYNGYSKDDQRLIKNTRLESSSGKIFRIDQSVVVPGMKGGVPGSVEVLVYADSTNKEYNIGIEQNKFTIPGFKGDPRYSKFWAMSVADSPIRGGFEGTVKVPSDADILAAREELKVDLKKIVAEKVRAQIPANASFFPGSMIIKFEEVPQEFSAEDTSNVSVKATASVFFFDTELLTEKLASLALPEDKEKAFTIPEMSSLTFTFIDPVDSVVLTDLTKLKFRIAGETTFVGKIDADKMRAELAGKNKKDFASMVVNQNNVYKADAVIRPMWKTMFPADSSKITVKIVTK